MADIQKFYRVRITPSLHQSRRVHRLFFKHKTTISSGCIILQTTLSCAYLLESSEINARGMMLTDHGRSPVICTL